MGANARYKDSVFSFLFSDPYVLRELYCALEGVSLPPDTPIDINTLQDVLFMGQLNDVSFTVDNRLVILIEHQSTINPNMPLRLLVYVARIYEKIVDRKKKYQSKLEKIPEPQFIVLYNGLQPYPDHAVLKLSDAYKDAAALKGAGLAGPMLELEVQVYNINKGHSGEITGKCETLKGYSCFVDKIRENEGSQTQEEAINAAIEYCIQNNILKQFLETHSSEVYNMLLTDWDIEEAKQVWFEEGREDKQLEIARNALAKGSPLEFVSDITGLDIETLKAIKPRN
jgi:rubrerythrin